MWVKTSSSGRRIRARGDVLTVRRGSYSSAAANTSLEPTPRYASDKDALGGNHSISDSVDEEPQFVSSSVHAKRMVWLTSTHEDSDEDSP